LLNRRVKNHDWREVIQLGIISPWGTASRSGRLGDDEIPLMTSFLIPSIDLYTLFHRKKEGRGDIPG